MKKRLMCVVAHPDDECVAFGGALALYAKQGVEVYILCLTDGQAATNRGEAMTPAELGQMRRKEFAASCQVLGASRYELLDYQDGQLEFQNVSEIAALLVERMRSWQPHVVVTFGLDGAVNTHPDHATVGSITSMAFQWSARPKRYPEQLEKGLSLWTPQKLYHQTSAYKLAGRPHLSPTPWSAELDTSSVAEIKLRAFQQHVSQLPIMQNFGPWEERNNKEHFLLVASTEPRQVPIEDDLFAGVTL